MWDMRRGKWEHRDSGAWGYVGCGRVMGTQERGMGRYADRNMRTRGQEDRRIWGHKNSKTQEQEMKRGTGRHGTQ